MNDYSIEQRYQLAKLFRTLKKDIDLLVYGLLTNTAHEHEVMLVCEQLDEFPKLTHGVRKLTLDGVTLNDKPISKNIEVSLENAILKEQVAELTLIVRQLRKGEQ